MNLTENLAGRVAAIKYEQLPEKTVRSVKRFILDNLGNMIRGMSQKPVQKIAAAAGVCSDGTEATVFGCLPAKKNSAMYAAMLNGAAAHSLDYDDLHNPSIVHAACVTVPAGLAVGETLSASGRDIIAALTAGYEAAARIGECINPESYYFWHTTATCGTISAAVAAGHLLRFDAEKMAQCIGTAGTQAGGLWEFLADGAMSKLLHIGKANYSGILSAKLTADGFTAARDILGGEKGFCRAMLAEPHWSKLTEDTGGYKIDDNSYRPYPCSKHTHPASDAVLLLRSGRGLTLENAAAFEVRTNSVAKRLVDNPEPENIAAAKFSVQYCVTAMLRYGRLGIDEFTEEKLHDAELREAMRRFKVIADEQIDREYKEKPDRWAAVLKAETKDGKIMEQLVEYPKGDPPNPMTWEEMTEKFMSLSEPVYGREISLKLINLIENLEQCKDFKKALADCLHK